MRTKSYNTIIIGGGLAGLTCAYKLQKNGISSLVLEAETQVGGRTREILVGDHKLELGAEFFTASYKNIVGVCKELGLELKSPAASKYAIKFDGKTWQFGYKSILKLLWEFGWKGILISPWLIGKVVSLIFTSRFNLRRLYSLTPDNLNHFLAKYHFPTEISNLADAICRLTFHYADGAAQMHAGFILNWLTYVLGGKYLVPVPGISSFAEALSSRINFLTSQKVIKLERIGAKWHVHTGQDNFVCDRIVFATSANVALELLSQIELPAEVISLLSNTKYSTLDRVYLQVTQQKLNSNEVNVVEQGGLIEFFTQPYPDLMMVKLNPDSTNGAINNQDLELKLNQELNLNKAKLIERIRLKHALPIYDKDHLSAVIKYLAIQKSFFTESGIILSGDYLWGPYTESAVYSGLVAAEIIIGEQ